MLASKQGQKTPMFDFSSNRGNSRSVLTEQIAALVHDALIRIQHHPEAILAKL